MLKIEKKDGQKDGAPMKLNSQNLKSLIREILKEAEEGAQKIATSSMGGASFASAGKEQRKEANPELSNLERGIVQQVDQFLLDIAELPGVELNNKKSVIQRVMKMLQKQVVPSTAQLPPEQSVAEGIDLSAIKHYLQYKKTRGDH
jgi:hypothetical protein